MAILDASGAFYKIFDMGDRELVAFDSPLVGGTSTDASWKTIYDAPGGISFPGETATLIAEGHRHHEAYVLVKGRLEVLVNGTLVAELGDGGKVRKVLMERLS